MIGKTLGHYKILNQLGRGGMGEVYLAEDLSLDRKVALKFLPDVFTGDPERMARFEREAKLLASLNHPNIAAIYGRYPRKRKTAPESCEPAHVEPNPVSRGSTERAPHMLR